MKHHSDDRDSSMPEVHFIGTIETACGMYADMVSLTWSIIPGLLETSMDINQPSLQETPIGIFKKVYHRKGLSYHHASRNILWRNSSIKRLGESSFIPKTSHVGRRLINYSS
jgi:hypothetical protein